MHRNKLIENKKSFILKVSFFLILLIFSMLIYLESRRVIDVLYFSVVLVLFIRFLSIKLYQ